MYSSSLVDSTWCYYDHESGSKKYCNYNKLILKNILISYNCCGEKVHGVSIKKGPLTFN